MKSRAMNSMSGDRMIRDPDEGTIDTLLSATDYGPNGRLSVGDPRRERVIYRLESAGRHARIEARHATAIEARRGLRAVPEFEGPRQTIRAMPSREVR
jgi:hypothetical protein